MATSSDTSVLKTTRVAVVEDNEDNQMLLEAVLEDVCASVKVYGDGLTALEGILRDPPDLILLDVSLPGMDGTEVLRRLRENPATAKIPSIALTAHAMAGDRERLLEAGFDAYISKPITDEDELLAAMAAMLARDGTRG